MKAKVFALITLTFALSASAANAGIICTSDARPRDGAYSEVRLEKNASGKYDLSTKVIIDGRGIGHREKAEVLLTDLNCKQDGVVATCSKQVEIKGGELPEIEFSLVEFKVVRVREIVGDKAVTMAPVVQITSTTWGKNNKREFSFALKDREGSCQATIH